MARFVLRGMLPRRRFKQERLHLGGRCLLHVWKHVGIGIEGEGNACVTQLFGDNLGGNAGAERQSCRSVTQIVKPYARQFGALEPGEGAVPVGAVSAIVVAVKLLTAAGVEFRVMPERDVPGLFGSVLDCPAPWQSGIEHHGKLHPVKSSVDGGD